MHRLPFSTRSLWWTITVHLVNRSVIHNGIQIFADACWRTGRVAASQKLSGFAGSKSKKIVFYSTGEISCETERTDNGQFTDCSTEVWHWKRDRSITGDSDTITIDMDFDPTKVLSPPCCHPGLNSKTRWFRGIKAKYRTMIMIAAELLHHDNCLEPQFRCAWYSSGRLLRCRRRGHDRIFFLQEAAWGKNYLLNAIYLIEQLVSRHQCHVCGQVNRSLRHTRTSTGNGDMQCMLVPKAPSMMAVFITATDLKSVDDNSNAT